MLKNGRCDRVEVSGCRRFFGRVCLRSGHVNIATKTSLRSGHSWDIIPQVIHNIKLYRLSVLRNED